MTNEDLLKNIEQIVDKQLRPIKAELLVHTQILSKHSQILDEHTQTLSKHSQILDEHTQLLGKHSQILVDVEKKLEYQSKLLTEHSKMLLYLKGRANRTYALVKYIGKDYDERIVHNSRRIDRIETHLRLPPLKTKH